ncbi:hypothetical protein D3C73_1166540 [compost metagenome]
MDVGSIIQDKFENVFAGVFKGCTPSGACNNFVEIRCKHCPYRLIDAFETYGGICILVIFTYHGDAIVVIK